MSWDRLGWVGLYLVKIGVTRQRERDIHTHEKLLGEDDHEFMLPRGEPVTRVRTWYKKGRVDQE